jgi:hypothetical protein
MNANGQTFTEDTTESFYEETHDFFPAWKKNRRRHNQSKAGRDIRSILKGRKDGKIVVENISSKTTSGARKLAEKHWTCSTTCLVVSQVLHFFELKQVLALQKCFFIKKLFRN